MLQDYKRPNAVQYNIFSRPLQLLAMPCEALQLRDHLALLMGPSSGYLPSGPFFGRGPSPHSIHMTTVEAPCLGNETPFPWSQLMGLAPDPGWRNRCPSITIRICWAIHTASSRDCIFNTQAWVQLGLCLLPSGLGKHRKSGWREREREGERKEEGGEREEG